MSRRLCSLYRLRGEVKAAAICNRPGFRGLAQLPVPGSADPAQRGDNAAGAAAYPRLPARRRSTGEAGGVSFIVAE
jgi:hypothetical protein